MNLDQSQTRVEYELLREIQFEELLVGASLPATPARKITTMLGEGPRQYTVVNSGQSLSKETEDHLIQAFSFTPEQIESLRNSDGRSIIVMSLRNGDTIQSATAAALELRDRTSIESSVVFKHSSHPELIFIDLNTNPIQK